MLPLGPPDEHDSPYKSASAFAASPKLLAEPARAGQRARRRSTSASARRTGSRTGSRSPARTRSTTRCASTASGRALRALRRRPRREADRRHPDLRRRRARPTSSRTRRSSRPARWPACRRTRSPTRASCGATRSMTGRALRRQGYAWWTARFKRVFELFDLARIDHFRGFVAYWAVPADAEFALVGGLEARPGPGAVRRRPRGAGRAAADRRGPRRDHAAGRPGCASRSACRGCRCCSSASRRASEHTVHVPGEQLGEPGRLHRHARQRHDPRLVRVDQRRAARAGRRDASSATASPTPSRTGR